MPSREGPDVCDPLDLSIPEPAPIRRPREARPSQRAFTRPVILNIVSFGILAFHTMTFDQLLPVFLSTPKGGEISSPIKFVGGFGFNNQTVGMIISVQGVYSIFSNTLLYPWVSRRIGELRLFKLLAMSYFMLYLATPYLVLLPERYRMAGIYFMVIWKCTFSTLAYPSNAIMLTNSAPSNLMLGTINGVAASTASLCRAFGPTIMGMLYALGLDSGYSGLAWWCASAITLIGAAVALQIPEVRGRLDEKEDVESPANEATNN